MKAILENLTRYESKHLSDTARSMLSCVKTKQDLDHVINVCEKMGLASEFGIKFLRTIEESM